MGIRVDANSLKSQLHEKGMYEKAAKFSYHQNILSTKLPLTIGGGIGQSRLFMLLLNKKEIAEVQVSDFEDKKESL
jgi:aspartate--ammonia ligase